MGTKDVLLGRIPEWFLSYIILSYFMAKCFYTIFAVSVLIYIF